nr:GrBNV_gp81-like protein [Apis mellifera nudivirus]
MAEKNVRMTTTTQDTEKIFKRITIDSNIASIPRMVANLLIEPSMEWCSSENKCRNIDTTVRAYYDTPISMCTAGACSEITIPDSFLNFVYMDFRLPNASLKRLRENLKSRQNVILIVAHEGAESERGMYHIRTTHCTLYSVAEAIATIINAFRSVGRLVHPDDIGDIVCGLKSTLSPPPPPRQLGYNMMYDICALMRRRNNLQSIENDCDECKLK